MERTSHQDTPIDVPPAGPIALLPLVVAVIVGLVGIANIAALAPTRSAIRPSVEHQALFLAFAVATGATVAAIRMHDVRRASWIAYGYGLVAVLALLAQHRYSHSSGVLTIPFLRFRIQPGELAKIGLVLGMAHALDDARSTRGTLRATAMCAVLVVSLIGTSNLAQAVVCAAIAGVMLMASRARVVTAVAVVGALLAATAFVHRFVLHAYQRERLVVFLTRHDPLGAGWLTDQANKRVASGGVFGGSYAQPFVQQAFERSDFSFANIAGRFGAAVACGLLLLYVGLVLWSFHVAARAEDRFSSLVAVGVGAFVGCHSLVNAAMVLGLAPPAQIPLALVSYGGSHLFATMIGLGLIASIALHDSRGAASSHGPIPRLLAAMTIGVVIFASILVVRIVDLVRCAIWSNF